MWFKRLIRVLWAIFGRVLLYGIAVIVILNIVVRYQLDQRGRPRLGGGGGWRGNREPAHRMAPRLNRDHDQSIRSQIEHYPLNVCVVDGNALDHYGEPVDYDHQGMVVRLCSEDCVREFRTDPAHYTKQLLEASLTP